MQAAQRSTAQVASAMDATVDTLRDQQHLMCDVPVTYQPFKFESRRVRIDWRLLHGVDINKLIRDTDLDTLEQLISCITWGDIEAEDTRHLSEGNFVKVFRLAQLLLEYLLYVQDNLKYTNSVLDSSRSRCMLHMQALSSRCRDLHTQLKHSKKELRRARKTANTLEIMANAVGSGTLAPHAAGAAATAAASTAHGPGVNVVMQSSGQEQQQQQAMPAVPGSWVTMQHAGAVASMTAGELLLQSQISELTERLAVAGCEAQRLREDREELQYQVRYLHDTLAARTDGIKSSQRHFSPGRAATLAPRGGAGSPWQQMEGAARVDAGALVAAQQLQHELQQQLNQQQEQQQQLTAEMAKLEAQVQQLQTENKGLRKQLDEQCNVDFSATNEVTAALQAHLDEKIEELLKLQDKLRQSEASIAVFKQANETLKQQYDALQKQLNSPEAVTPSFLKKQRNSMVAAEASAAKTQALVEQLQSENVNLEKQVAALQAQLAARGQPVQQPQQSAGSDDAAAAAERLLAGKGMQGSAQQQSDWKLAEIERLQEENRLLHKKVESLQAQVHDLERLNAQLDRQAAKARALGVAASLELGGRSPSPAKEGTAGGPGHVFSGWAGGSINSSGPREELTAADLAAGMAGATGDESFESDDEHAAVEPVTISAKTASKDGQSNSSNSPVQNLLQKFGGKAAGGDAFEHDSSPGPKIAAFKPEQHQQGSELQQVGLAVAAAAPAAEAPKPTAVADNQPTQSTPEDTAGSASSTPAVTARTGAGNSGGNISREAGQQLKTCVAEMVALPAEEKARIYGEACDDWDKPFDLNPDERELFGSILPLEMPGRSGLLLTQPHDKQELAANRGRLLVQLNRQLDAQLATFGIHPGRTGLSTPEFMAATRLLGERRESWASRFSPELQNQIDVMRVGLMLHAYNAQQAVLQQQPMGPDGKQHLPGPVAPVLVSEVRPPPSMLPAGPPTIRTTGGLGLLGGTLPRGMAGVDEAGSPLKAALQGAAASHVTSRAASYTTATYHATGSASGRSSPELTQAVITKAISAGGYSPMSAALHAKQQLGQLSPRSAAAVAAGLDPAAAAVGSVQSDAPRESSVSPRASTTATSRFAPQGAAVASSVTVSGSALQVAPKVVASFRGAQSSQQQQPEALRPPGPGVAAGAPWGAAAVAVKEYLNSSFNDSDEF